MSMVNDIQAAETEELLGTIEELLKGGEHEGECTNTRSYSKSCRLHIAKSKEREMAARTVVAKWRNQKPMDYKELISKLAEAPDGMLAIPLAQECLNFKYEGDEEALKFLRDLRDKAVHTGGASDFTMQMFHVTLDLPHPEPPEERKARQSELERTWLRGEEANGK